MTSHPAPHSSDAPVPVDPDVLARLQASERRFRTLVERSPDLVALLTSDAVITWCSPASHRLLGRTQQELAGTRLTELVHPADVPALTQVLGGRVAEVMTPVMARLRHRDGHHVWTETTGVIELDPVSGDLQIQTTTRDVSARVRSELERDQALETVTAVLDQAPIGMSVRPLDGGIVQVNQALCAMFGATRDEMVGSRVKRFAHPDDGVGPDEGMRLLLSGAVQRFEEERRYVRLDGEVIWCHRTSVLLRGPDGEPRHVLTQLHDITQRRRAQAELAAMAVSDPLTGLPNRRVLLEHLEEARLDAHAPSTALMFLDLDGFKVVNDTLGHDCGDELLRQAAERLRTCIRDGDMVARWGGDEFVVFCPDVGTRAHGRELGERVRQALRRPFVLKGRQVEMSVSVGVVVGHAPDAEALIGQADAMMYVAKRAGRDRVDVQLTHANGIEGVLDADHTTDHRGE